MYDKEVYHFLFLHFPIGLFITGFIFHIFYILNHSVEAASKVKEYIYWTMGMGIIWGLLSIITGYITAIELGYMESLLDIYSKRHSMIMLFCISYFIILFIIRTKSINNKILLFFNAGGVALLMYGAHLGAKWADRI